MGGLQLDSDVLHRVVGHHDRSPLGTADVAQLHLVCRPGMVEIQRYATHVRFRVLQRATVDVQRSGALQRDSGVVQVVHLELLGVYVQFVVRIWETIEPHIPQLLLLLLGMLHRLTLAKRQAASFVGIHVHYLLVGSSDETSLSGDSR